MHTKKTSLISPSALLIVTIAILGIVIYAGNVMAVNTSKITDIICLASFTFMPVSGIVCAVCFLIPLHSGITGLYIYGYAVLMILLKSKKIRLGMLLPLFLIITYELIMMAFVGATQFNYILTYALTMFLLFYMMHTEEVDARAACISYICGTLALLICVFTTAVQNYSLGMILAGLVRIGEYEGAEELGEVAVVTENANAMAYYALVAVIIAFCMLKRESLRGKILLSAAMLIATIIPLFTVSRSFIIILLAVLLISYLSGYNFKQRAKILVIVGLILAVVIPLLLQRTQIFAAFTERFEDESMLTGTGRVDIFLEYMQFLWDHPWRLIFGTGSVFYKDVCQLGHSMHNGTQQILVSYGVLGFLPMLGVLVAPVIGFFRKNKFQLVKILPLIAVILFTQTIQFLNPNNLILPYAVAILYMKMPDAEDVK